MKNRFFLGVLFVLCSCSSTHYKKYKTLSKPHKNWVLKYPLKAKRALQISEEAKRVADSMKTSSLLDGDASGGQVDAFRHGYWMARLKQEIGENAALALGKAHEKDNYIFYKENKLEDGVLPDKASMEMDLYNNKVGVSLITKSKKLSQKELIALIVTEIKKGRFKILKKDSNKNYLTCTGNILLKKELRKWINNKCLVNSNVLSD